MTVEAVIKAMSRWQYDLATEAAMHRSLAGALDVSSVKYQREVNLTDEDRIDFYLPKHKIGIEVKLSCSSRQIYRQIQRYAESEKIDAIILLSNTAVGLPKEINGASVYVVHAGMAGL